MEPMSYDELREHMFKVVAERDKLLAFKKYVHSRLDAAGVTVDPESSHKAEGCRIGGRLDEVFARVAELESALRPLARCVPWLPDGTEDDVYLGTQLRGMDNDVTPSIGQCRRAAKLLKGAH